MNKAEFPFHLLKSLLSLSVKEIKLLPLGKKEPVALLINAIYYLPFSAYRQNAVTMYLAISCRCVLFGCKCV